MVNGRFLNAQFGECVNSVSRSQFGVRSSELIIKSFWNIDWMAQRTIIKRMPSSISEKAHSSTEPKAMGVKIRRIIKISFMILFNIAQSSKLNAQSKNYKSTHHLIPKLVSVLEHLVCGLRGWPGDIWSPSSELLLCLRSSRPL